MSIEGREVLAIAWAALTFVVTFRVIVAKYAPWVLWRV